MSELSEIVILGGVFAVGLIGSGIYYFARFFLFKDMRPNTQLLKKKGNPKKVDSLFEALSNSRKSIWRLESDLPLDSIQDLEEALYIADLGPDTVAFLIERVQEQIKGEKFSLDKIKNIFKSEMTKIFKEDFSAQKISALIKEKQSSPHVIAIVGVNGAGKTTTIGKLAYKFSQEGKKVMIVAGDTFRAGAETQLSVWAEKSNTLIFKALPQTKDPGAVAFQAYEKAKKEEVDILLIDTAGRLHTQDNLMQELKKVKRVLSKQDIKAPQDIWMILDANMGMNVLHQTKVFHKTLGLTGVIMTKVEGSAKAGMALGVKQSLGIPILMLGTGEGIKDIRLFNSQDFVSSLVSSKL